VVSHQPEIVTALIALAAVLAASDRLISSLRAFRRTHPPAPAWAAPQTTISINAPMHPPALAWPAPPQVTVSINAPMHPLAPAWAAPQVTVSINAPMHPPALAWPAPQVMVSINANHIDKIIVGER
jgi:hypothetical protein